ncbi:response regulator transcription factor [bacterium]|nr:response regulator transcription factor [bacterium]
MLEKLSSQATSAVFRTQLSVSSEQLSTSLTELPRLKILIVEDEPLLQLSLQQFFEEYPKYAIVAQETDGLSAIKTALEQELDLVLMDIGLPQLDGIEATQQIKAQRPDLKVVILTSHHTETEIIAALASGADAYCIKGNNLERLLNVIALVQEGTIYLDPQIARIVVENLRSSVPIGKLPQLSARELEVLKLIVEGYTNREIASMLFLSFSTVKHYIRNIMNKLSVDDRVQVAVVALRSGLV